MTIEFVPPEAIKHTSNKFIKIISKSNESILNRCPQVLAVDLLNPAPQAEARKHKLKVCQTFIPP